MFHVWTKDACARNCELAMRLCYARTFRACEAVEYRDGIRITSRANDPLARLPVCRSGQRLDGERRRRALVLDRVPAPLEVGEPRSSAWALEAVPELVTTKV